MISAQAQTWPGIARLSGDAHLAAPARARELIDRELTMAKYPRSSSSPEGQFGNALAAFQESLPVSLIAVDRDEFVTCKVTDKVSEVLEKIHGKDFDYLPAVADDTPDTEILGVLEVASASRVEADDRTVDDCMCPLGEHYLLGADASILAFVRDAAQNPFRLLVSGNRISGLVSMADLHQLPVRAALFAILTHLEMTMTDVIRTFIKPDWMGLLSDRQRVGVRSWVKKAQKENTSVDPLLYTGFGDKVDIITKGWPFPESAQAGDVQFKAGMTVVKKFRNKVAHANTYTAASAFECVEKMDSWIEFLERRLEAETKAVPNTTGDRA